MKYRTAPGFLIILTGFINYCLILTYNKLPTYYVTWKYVRKGDIMGNLKVGDIVARKSYGEDILFKVVDIVIKGNENIATLKGITYRIEADAPESDLIVQSEKRIKEYTRSIDYMVERKLRNIIGSHQRRYAVQRGYPKKLYSRDTSYEEAKKFTRAGKVLHIDGDNDYLETCLAKYNEFGIDAVGKYIPENNQPSAIYSLLHQYKPDIVVLTGHDGFIKNSKNYSNINSYRNSKYFIDAVKEARRYDRDYDSLVIFAGACQSMYNGILESGANFCSSPYRVLIHALDPVMVCCKIALTSVDDTLQPSDVIRSTITGFKGIGGVQTRGKKRDGYPAEPYYKE